MIFSIRTVCGLAVIAACASQPSARDRPAPEEINPVRISGPQGGIGSAELRNEASGRSMMVAAPVTSVWSTLPKVYERLGIAAGADTAQKLFGIMELRTNRIAGQRLSEFIDCGRGFTAVPLADDYDVTLSVLTRVNAGEVGWSVLTSTVRGRAKPRGVSGNSVYCQSTGRLEQRIADLVLKALDGS